MAPMPEAPRIGTEFAGYRIDSLIGRGGMSVVYRAENPRLGNMVALKLLSSELADDETFRERFVRESRLAAGLNHPNIIPIYDAGAFDGVLYIAMRYVEGSDLKQLIRTRGGLAPEQAVAILAQVARALDAAHRRGLVHRDVKPANILVEGDEDGNSSHAYLADFGLMKHPASRTGLTATGQFMGTIDYVAPEQIEGREVDARTDEYSLGCVLYECLTGRVPFVKDADVAVMWAHMNEAPERVSVLRPGIPAALDAVIAKALSKAPDDRYQTCSEMVAAAAAAVAGAATAPAPVPADATRARPAPVPIPVPVPEPEPAAAAPPPAAEPEQVTRAAVPPPPPPSSPKPPSGRGSGSRGSRAPLLVAALLAATLIGAGAAYAINRSTGDSSSAGTTHKTGAMHTTGSTPTSGMSSMPSSGDTMDSTSDGQMALGDQFKQTFPDLVDSCQFTDTVMCMDMPAVSINGKKGRASQLTLTPFTTSFERGTAYTHMFNKARASDSKLGDAASGPCYGHTWEHENYWYHTPEHQEKVNHGANGNVFCYTNDDGDKVIVWTQEGTMDNTDPFIGEVVAPTTVDAFRTFFYVHHNIGM